jgi:hypothetical protein
MQKGYGGEEHKGGRKIYMASTVSPTSLLPFLFYSFFLGVIPILFIQSLRTLIF